MNAIPVLNAAAEGHRRQAEVLACLEARTVALAWLAAHPDRPDPVLSTGDLFDLLQGKKAPGVGAPGTKGN